MSPALLALVFALAIGAVQAPAPLAALQGRVSIEPGGPTTELTVVLFPSDPSTWASATASGRFHAVPVTNGTFAIPTTPPDVYRISVLDAETAKQWPTRELLLRLAPRAFQFRLQEAPEAIDLVVGMTGGAPALVQVQLSSSTTGPLSGVPRPAGPRGTGVASGTVYDADKRPVANADVRIFRRSVLTSRSSVPDGVSQLVMAAPPITRTDAAGAYRFSNLQPGTYFIAVMAYSVDTGDPRRVSTRRVPDAPPSPDGITRDYVMTFYPNASSHATAQPVVIEADERAQIDITLEPQPVADVTGTIASDVSLPLVQWLPANVADQLGGVNLRHVTVAPDGRFEIPSVPFGEYLLMSNDPRAAFRVPVTVAGPVAPLAIDAERRPMRSGEGMVRP